MVADEAANAVADEEENAVTVDSHHEEEEDKPLPPTKWQNYAGWFATDLLVYVVILNLAAELVRNIHVNRFSISLCVAIMLKLVMDSIQYLEHKIHHLFCEQLGRKIIGGFFMWLVIFSSKFLILWMDDVIFGDQVELGYFWEIMVLSAVLLASEKLVRFLFDWLGRWERQRANAKSTKNEAKNHDSNRCRRC